MACGARSGLKQEHSSTPLSFPSRLNGLWSPFGIETNLVDSLPPSHFWAKWPVEPVRDSCESRILMPFMHESTFIHLSDS